MENTLNSTSQSNTPTNIFDEASKETVSKTYEILLKDFKVSSTYFEQFASLNNTKTYSNNTEFIEHMRNYTTLVKLYLEKNKSLPFTERKKLENYLTLLRKYAGNYSPSQEVMKEGEYNPNKKNFQEIKPSLLSRYNPFSKRGGAIKLRSKKNKRSMRKTKRKTHSRKHV